MSAQDPATMVEWYATLPIPWLVAGLNGQSEARAWPTVADQHIELLREAAQVSFPDRAPADALPYLGGNRGLIQGAAESDANFRVRLKFAWDTWTRAGTWVGLLEQLYWAGYIDAVIVQQNGYAFTLSGPPTAGVDPTPLLVTTACSHLSVALTSDVTPTRSIPVGQPWWQFAESRSANPRASDTDYCNRFAVLFPRGIPMIAPVWATATFTGVEDGSLAHPWPVATWSAALQKIDYRIIVGLPTITDGSGGVECYADGTTKTLSGVTIAASMQFGGNVDVAAYGVDLSGIQKIIRTWRPNGLCVGVYSVTYGKMFGWPPQVQSANTMGPATITRYEGG